MAKANQRGARKASQAARTANTGQAAALAKEPPVRRTRPPRTARASRQGGMDWRWIAVGITAVVLIGIIGFNMFGGSGSTASVNSPVGEVTGPSSGITEASAPLAVGTKAPNFEWTVNGVASSLDSLKGKPVLLVGFASWCPHCQREAPIISSLQQKYGDKGLNIIGVNASPLGLDQRSPTSIVDIEKFMNQYNAHYQNLYDKNLVVGRMYGVRSFPSLFIIDKDGVIKFFQDGETPEATLVNAIEPLLPPAS